MRRILRYAAACLALISAAAIAIYLFPPRPVLAWLAERNPDVLFFVETERPAVALTIDDGPSSELTPRILELLAEHGAHATFFLIGDRIAGNEELLAEMSAGGHELANHLQSDEPSFALTAGEFEQQLDAVDSLLPAGSTKWFRPGSGWFHARMLRQLASGGYRCSLGSFPPLDPHLSQPWLITEHILRQLAAGSIIILHEGTAERAHTLRVLERLLPEVRARGFEILTLRVLGSLEGER